ncbi:hypothetical protein Tanf_06240 [Tannerella forsythia]|nr:hypothetical protein Tanf_06240 [Tannerella forsythia]
MLEMSYQFLIETLKVLKGFRGRGCQGLNLLNAFCIGMKRQPIFFTGSRGLSLSLIHILPAKMVEKYRAIVNK